MSRKIQLILNLVLASILVTAIVAFKPSSTKIYQHMMIITENPDSENAFISIDGKDYSRQKKLKREIQGPWDVGPVINIIHQYEAEGWELQSFSGNGNFLYYWLRKEK